MVVFLLYSNWMLNGDNAVNEVIGIYDCLPKAQQALADCIYNDLNSHPYDHIEGDGDKPITEYNIYELANMFFDDPEFSFNVNNVKLWNGEDEDLSEDFQSYSIEARELS